MQSRILCSSIQWPFWASMQKLSWHVPGLGAFFNPFTHISIQNYWLKQPSSSVCWGYTLAPFPNSIFISFLVFFGPRKFLRPLAFTGGTMQSLPQGTFPYLPFSTRLLFKLLIFWNTGLQHDISWFSLFLLKLCLLCWFPCLLFLIVNLFISLFTDNRGTGSILGCLQISSTDYPFFNISFLHLY